MERCSDCKHFQRPDSGPFRGWGSCGRLHDDYDTNHEADAPPDGRLAIPWDYEGYSAGLYVSPNFGCTQFEASADREPGERTALLPADR